MLQCHNINCHSVNPISIHHKGGRIMRLNAPTQNFWWISVVLAVVAVVAQFVVIPFVSVYAFWIVCVGFAVLCLSTVLKGM